MIPVKPAIAPLKYQQIGAELVSTIQSGAYRTGDKLPSESVLADTFSASRSTVIRALRSIKEQGLIERRQGSGSYVTSKATQQPATRTAIGLLKTAQSGRFTDSVADQLQSRLGALLQQRGSALIVHTIEREDDPLEVARKLLEQRIGGTFMVPMPPRFNVDANQEIADLFTNAGRPVILLDGDFLALPHRSDLDVVSVENRHCGYLQTEHLLNLGLRRILFLGANPPGPNGVERQLGYLDAMRARGLDAPADWTCETASDDINESFVSGLIERHRPEGIVCKSDEFAALLMRNLIRLGIRVPEDVKLVGFDDRPIASLLPVTLTTIRQPIQEIAESALRLMDARLAHPDRAASRTQVSGKLIIRQSSAG